MKYALLSQDGTPVAFYDADLHGDTIPADAVPLTEAQWLECIHHPGHRRIVTAADGTVTVEPYTPPVTWPEIRASRDARLAQSEARWAIEVRRHAEQLRLIDLGEPVELYRSPEWMAATELEVLRYHQALRDIPQVYEDPAAVEWPPPPSFMDADPTA